MNRRGFLVGSAGVAIAGAAIAEGCSAGSSFLNPGGGPVNGGYTLTVGYTNSTIGGKRIRTRTYNGSTVGPTLDVFPGNTLAVKIVNQLPANPPATVPSGAVHIADAHNMSDMMRRRPAALRVSADPLDPMNNPHLFNTTNLHVHGIQTLPHLFDPIGTSNPAAMMIAIDPGETFQYDFPVPADQPPGLYWYHPHHHGSTDVQVSGGMAGLIVVHGAIDTVPEIAAARDIRVVVQSLNLNASPTDPTLYEYEPTAYVAPPQGYNLGTDISLYTVNGQAVCFADNNANTYTPMTLPQTMMQPGEVIRLRLLNGTNGFWLPLVLPGCEIHMIAFDGVNFQAPFQVAQDGTTLVTPANMNDNSMVFTSPGNRMEMLIKAPTTPGTYKLSALATNGVNFMPFPQLDLMNFVVAGTAVNMNIPTTLPTPTREYPLIGDGDILRNRTIVFSEGPADTLLTGFGFFIDNRLYNEEEINYTVQNGTCEEWTIENAGAEAHPFHLHENSFEVTHVNGNPVPVALWDTFVIPPSSGAGNGSFTMRVRFKGEPGKTVFHCHILPHEDTGMMQNLMMV
jgi:FtsP/CotA-like multicopper oxidase with cupredoxin domain